jgi:hypothetical protein
MRASFICAFYTHAHEHILLIFIVHGIGCAFLSVSSGMENQQGKIRSCEMYFYVDSLKANTDI